MIYMLCFVGYVVAFSFSYSACCDATTCVPKSGPPNSWW